MANALPELPPPRLSGFGDPQVRVAGFLPIGAGLLLRSGSTSMQVIDDRFRFLPGSIQQLAVCGIGAIRRPTGGIDEQLAVRGSGLVVPFSR